MSVVRKKVDFLKMPGDSDETLPSQKLKPMLVKAVLTDPVEKAVSFGRWWYDPGTQQLLLSSVSAGFLSVESGLHDRVEACFTQVMPDDVLMLLVALENGSKPGGTMDCDFRVINELDGMRWLRMMSLPQMTSGLLGGILINTTASRHASMRERIGFESTQYLVGAQKLSEALTRVIQSVCENLGWEWGAYWSVEVDEKGESYLECKHYWHDPAYALSFFTQKSRQMRIGSGEELVGHVWQTGRPSWVEGHHVGANCPRSQTAIESGLQSGYAFPVAYMMDDGAHHRPGVLEFFSSLSRQREAQLPNLSSAIGMLVAQTVQRMEQTEIIRRMAQIDEMTELANRRHFHSLVNLACLEAAEKRTTFGLLFVDLDHFKPINDAFGHDAGNVVLSEFSRRLMALVPPGSHIGRLGGDEFAILSPPISSQAELTSLAEEVLEAANLPFVFGGRELLVSASIGISVYPENGATTPELLRTADAAMYRSKNGGRNAYHFFSGAVPSAQTAHVQKLSMEIALHQALDKKELFLEYQPIFDSFGHRVKAVEALVRWRRDDGELVRPDAFVPVAEQSQLIVQIGRWVLKQACNDLVHMHDAGLDGLQVNVNMAATEFLSGRLPEEAQQLAEEVGLDPSHVCLELTEGMVMRQADKVIPIMQQLRKQGFHISLDDFGMGHSSLSRLKTLPISSLKIDRSFVRGIPGDCGDCAIVRTIFDLGQHMKLQVIAEGVETDAQLGFLQQFGYPMIQGFLLGRPMPLEKLLALYGRKN